MDLEKAVEAYEYISFDLFDTLIFRTFEKYDDVFEYVEYTYNRHSLNKISSFKRKRIRAEKIARKKKHYNEICLDEIYREIKIDNSIRDDLKQLEIDVEIKNCIPNIQNISLLNKLKKTGKKIVITTDMYLPEQCIKSILDKVGIEYDYLFISCECGKTKADGSLFNVVLDTLNINADQMIHVGDNVISDYENPRKLGIASFHYVKEEWDDKYRLKTKSLLINHYNTLAYNGIVSTGKNSNEFRFGFCVLGPIVNEFCKWINKEIKEKKIDAVLFLAREGYEIKKCYELLYPENNDICHYAKLNKKVLNKAIEHDEQGKLLEKYLDGFSLRQKKIGLVNNSYSGTGQSLLTKFTLEKKYKVDFYGLQFASNKVCQERLGSSYSSWLNERGASSLQAYLFERGSLIFEHMLFKPQGTSLHLLERDNNVDVETEQPRKENVDFCKIAEFQQGMEAFINMNRDNVEFDCSCEPINYFINVIQKPSFQDAMMLGSLWDDDDYGDRQIIDFAIPFNKSVIYKNDVYDKIAWIQGYLVGKKVPSIYLNIFNTRLWLTNLLHRFQGVE